MLEISSQAPIKPFILAGSNPSKVLACEYWFTFLGYCFSDRFGFRTSAGLLDLFCLSGATGIPLVPAGAAQEEKGVSPTKLPSVS